ncbi:RNA-binding protein 5-like [Limanda limanda]|uniref:RNA-binding protein 5-like n=1 Tax=Limanda limanda TaxID=27771 RepID=UPI0029C69E02|nr:RNA-binding protein 5-like [Limanda limanda]
MMDTNKRLSRGERSGRYGPDNIRDDMDWHKRPSGYVERDYNRGRVDDRHRDRLDDCRDSPERGRKRSHCDSSDDEYDGDRPDQDHKTVQRERNKPIALRGLPPNITEEEIRAALEQLQGPQPASIGVFKKMTGITQDFPVMEFYHVQDSTRWMKTNQYKLVIQGKRVSVKYSYRRAMYDNWLCKSCGLCNFRRRPNCIKCGVDGESPAVDSINVEPQQESDTDTLILRNIAPISSIDGILNMLSPYAILSASQVHLMDHNQMKNNKGLGFVQLSSPLEASELLTILQSLQPPLKLDGKTLAVNYAKSSIRNGAQHCGKQATHISVASTAIAATHWPSSQLQPGSDATSDFVTPPEGFLQQSQEPNYQVWQQQHLKGLSLVNGDGFPGAAPGMKTLLPAATGVVISQTAQIYQPVVFSQTAIQSHHVAMAVDAEQQQHQQHQQHQMQHQQHQIHQQQQQHQNHHQQQQHQNHQQQHQIHQQQQQNHHLHQQQHQNHHQQQQPHQNHHHQQQHQNHPQQQQHQNHHQQQQHQIHQQQHQNHHQQQHQNQQQQHQNHQQQQPPQNHHQQQKNHHHHHIHQQQHQPPQNHHQHQQQQPPQNHHHHHQQQPPQNHHHQQQQPPQNHHHHIQQHQPPQNHHQHQQQQQQPPQNHHHQQQQQQQPPQSHHHQQQQPPQNHHHHHQQQQPQPPQNHHQQQQPPQNHHHQQHQNHQQQHQNQQHQNHHQQQQHQNHHQQQQHQNHHQQQQQQQNHHQQQQQQNHQQQQQQPPASVSKAPPVTPAASSVSPTVSASQTIKTSADPDMSTYQFDKDSGYYYDPQTRLYYDPSSQYYYNSETQEYLYWDGEKQTYVQATEDMMAEQSSSSPEPKGKKKAKTRSSQKIAENMERWAKSLNRRKGSSKSSVQDSGPSKEEDKKCSSAADAGFSLFKEKQSRDFEMPSLMNEQFKIPEQETKSDPFVSYNGDNEPEEGGMDGAADDWMTGVCLLCQRQFPTKDALLRHEQRSDLHKQNVEIQKRSILSEAEKGRRDAELKYRDRAAERRGRSGAYTAKKEFQPPAHYGKPTNNGPRQSNNIGNHRFPAMGWQKGSDLGHHQ